jgi:hypothetical protein
MSDQKEIQNVEANGELIDYHSGLLKHVVGSSAATLINKDADADDPDGLFNQSKQFIGSFKPKDAKQAMLAAQMIAVHELQQHHTCYAKQAKHPRLRSLHTKDAAKLANVFLKQLQTFEKMQGKGEQKIMVEHVSVHPGAQAVVGSVINAKQQKGDDV